MSEWDAVTTKEDMTEFFLKFLEVGNPYYLIAFAPKQPMFRKAASPPFLCYGCCRFNDCPITAVISGSLNLTLTIAYTCNG